MLEQLLHQNSAFVTLTYADETLPLTSTGLATLESMHLRNWLKLLRNKIAPLRIRFFAVGEYGDVSERPHYHAALFGHPTCVRGRTLRRPGHSRPEWEACCDVCRLVGYTWKKGDVDLGTLTPESAQYIAGYVTKKLVGNHPKLLGRHPEFGRQSNRPGIGADFMHEVASTLLEHGLESLEDVPTQLQHGGRKLPLGSYLTRRLRKLVGHDEKAPQVTLDRIQEELQPLRETAFNASRSFKAEVVKDGEQKRLNQATRAKIFKTRRDL